MVKILFVCTGNICRSSGAEAVLRHYTDDKDVMVDSAGTHGYHVGDKPDRRGVNAAAARGISMAGMQARKVSADDFNAFDHIIAMDQGHYQILENLRPEKCRAKMTLFSGYCSEFQGKDVPDPYYGDDAGFETVLDILEDGAQGIIKKLV